MSKVLRNWSGKKRGFQEEVVTILEVGVLEINIFLVIWYGNTKGSVFIRHRRSENSPATIQNSPAKFRSFPERALLFHNNSPVTLHYSPATTILNEIPDGTATK